MLWTEPLPKVCSPTMMAWVMGCKSCRQPATISAALALLPLTSTTIGISIRLPRPLARYSEIGVGPRPSVETISWSRGRNFSQTWPACSSRPPGLSRKSMISALAPSPVNCLRALFEIVGSFFAELKNADIADAVFAERKFAAGH